MVNIKMFKHPQYYKNLRKLARLRNRDQAISLQPATAASARAPGTGLRGQAKVLKQQATSLKPQAPSLDKNLLQAASPKQQAPSFKPKDSSAKIPEPGNN